MKILNLTKNMEERDKLFFSLTIYYNSDIIHVSWGESMKKFIIKICITLLTILLLILIYFSIFNKEKKKEPEEIVVINVSDVTSNTYKCTNDPVEITVTGTSNRGSIVAYSYDDGETWTDESKYTSSINKKVNIKIKDELDNISPTYVYNITNINDSDPVITFPIRTEIQKGESIDLTKNVIANDKCTGRPLKIDISPRTINSNKSGEVTITYTVTGTNNKIITKSRKILIN